MTLQSLKLSLFGRRQNVRPEALELFAEATCRVDPGLVRDHNEDSVLVVHPNSSETLRLRGVLAVLADGMGGHAAGEIASKLACDTISFEYYAAQGAVETALRTSIEKANKAIFKSAQSDRGRRGMGTTCVALTVVGTYAHFAWVGDSRIYLVRDGSIYRLSQDHTLLNQMIADGLLTEAEVNDHPDRGVLSRALGTQQTVVVSSCGRPMKIRLHDRFLLCSDGLHDLVQDCDLLEVMQSGTIEQSSQSLVEHAIKRGGSDNISVIVVNIRNRENKPALGRNAKETREIDLI